MVLQNLQSKCLSMNNIVGGPQVVGHSFISFTILVQNGSYPGINPVCFLEQYLQIGMLAPHKPILEPVEVSEKRSEILLTGG